MSLKYFGTDGIRGTFGTEPITEQFATKVALGVANYLNTRQSGELNKSVVIGRDPRFSGERLENAFFKAFCNAGFKVWSLGIVPTPQVAFAVGELNATVGLAITASHNPVSDNGFKFFKSNGTKFTIEEEIEIESYIDASSETTASAGSLQATDQSSYTSFDVKPAYFDKLRRVFSGLDLSGMRIIVDTANGATCGTTPEFLRSLGAEVLQMGDTPDGKNINTGVGSEYPDALSAAVVAEKCDIGVAHDGDGDRVVVIDPTGDVLSGEHFLAIISAYSPSISSSSRTPLVTTSMSNFALDSFLKHRNIDVQRTDVGDRNVAYQMLENSSPFGGENSGHYICADVLKTGDGLVAFLKLMEAVHASGKNLIQLKNELQLYPSKLLNLRVANKLPLEHLTALQDATRAAEEKINGNGRVMLRYSGTENKLRILAECESHDVLESTLASLERAARADLEVLP